MINVKLRRAIGLIITLLFLVFYVALATSLGNLFINKPLFVRILYFSIAGIIWIFPLKPIYVWMRPKPDEIIQTEKPPTVSNYRKSKR